MEAAVPTRPIVDVAVEPPTNRASVVDARATAPLAVVRRYIPASNVVDGPVAASTTLARVGKFALERLPTLLPLEACSVSGDGLRYMSTYLVLRLGKDAGFYRPVL